MGKRGLSGWLIWAIIFFIVAVVTGIFGLGLISGASFTVARWLAVIFVILFIVSIVAHTIKQA